MRTISRVRIIFGISCLLLGFATLACRVEHLGAGAGDGADSPAAEVVVRWVRTVDGWERTDGWNTEAVEQPSLHPLVVAAGQGLMSVLALAAAGRDDPRGEAGKKRSLMR